MHLNPRVRFDRWRHGRAREADQVDIAATSSQRSRVILHPWAAAKISDYDNGGSHLPVYLLVGLTSAVLALVLTPVIGRGSTRLGLVDAPGGRKVHTHPVPRLGGVALVLSAVLALLFVVILDQSTLDPQLWPAMRPFLIAVGLIFLVGLVDDVRGVSPAPKLIFELAAAAVIMSSGLLIERVTLLGWTWNLGWVAWPVTAVWLVGLTNAFNLIDGVDGLAAGIAVLAGSACCAILIARGHSPEAMLLAAMVGSAIGFLCFNFAPASIFLGDSGSLVIGFLLAATAITGWQKGATALAAGVPLMIFALPIVDSALALIRRGTARPSTGRSIGGILHQIAQPDREHIHHRLLAMGWSVRQIVLVLYAITLILSLLALATADVSQP
jgi:UDP-GlcNAc:undecaprenyl-phosphate/decaprenyl-phosphate GlcNAc-1-phosphate transferase